MFGVLGAYFSVFVNSWWNKIRKPAFIFGVCLLSIDVVMQNRLLWRDYITLTATPLAALCLLPLLSSWKNCPHPFFKVINFVSLISYSLYLVNFSLVKYILLDLYIDNAPGYFSKTAVIYITYWIMNIVIAYFIWRFVEKPFLKLRERSYRIKHFQTESN